MSKAVGDLSPAPRAELWEVRVLGEDHFIIVPGGSAWAAWEASGVTDSRGVRVSFGGVRVCPHISNTTDKKK